MSSAKEMVQALSKKANAAIIKNKRDFIRIP
jgi:hypothetical protein